MNMNELEWKLIKRIRESEEARKIVADFISDAHQSPEEPTRLSTPPAISSATH